MILSNLIWLIFLKLNSTDAPECRSNQKFIYGIEFGETTVIDCNLISNPSDRLTFHWRYHDANGDTIDLATISSQIDDTYKRSSPTNVPLYSALQVDLKHQNSSNNEPVPSRYLPFQSNLNDDKSLSSSFLNKPLMPSSDDRGTFLQQIFISSNGSSSSLHYTMKNTKKEVGKLF